jgi:hypothetical protein
MFMETPALPVRISATALVNPDDQLSRLIAYGVGALARAQAVSR